MKKNIRKKVVLAILSGLLVFSPVQSVFVEAAGQVSSSSDSRLSILDIKPGTLNPAFSPDVYEYSSTVESGVTSVEVQAVPNAAGGSIASVEGAANLQEGLNKITVVSSAPDQSYVTYTINLTVGEAEEETAEEESVADLDTQAEDAETEESEEKPGGKAAKLIGSIGSDGTVTLDGADYKLSNNFSINGIVQVMPSGYEQGSVDVLGTEYQTVCYKKSNVNLVFMENTDGNGSTGFYYYDEEQKTVERFKYLSVGDSFLVMANNAREEVPAGFSQKIVTLPSEKKVIAYENLMDEDAKGIFLVYGVSSKGVQGWYYYDKSEGTYMRYLQPAETAPVIEDSEEMEESQRTISLEKYNTLYSKYDALKKGQVRVVSISLIALVLLLIVFTIIYMKWKDLVEESTGSGHKAKEADGRQKSKASLQNGRKRSGKQPSIKRTIITSRKEKAEETGDPAELERRQREQEERQQIQREQEERERKQREFEERERQRAAYERMEQLEYQKEMQNQAKQASEDVKETLQKREPSVVRKTTLTREVQHTSEDAMIQAQEKMRQSVQLARRTPMKDPTRQIPDVDKESVFRPTKRIKLSEAEKQKEHDPMDDWEVEETSGSKRAPKKKRGRLEEDMEIMDLNDL